MLNRNAFLLGTAMAVALVLPAHAEDTAASAQTPATISVDGDTILATVNGDDITMAHVIAARLGLAEQFQSLPNDVLLPGLVEQLIQQTVLSQAIGEVSRRTSIQLENQRREIVAAEMIDSVISGAVTDEALKAEYDAQFDGAEPTEEFNASHILVETEDKAKELIAELEGGADFAALAKTHSTGPSGPNGGELGWFSSGMMVKPFEDAVVALDRGAVSAPVQTQFGWHVIILNDKRMQGAPALEEVREELAAKIENDAIEAALAKLLEAATIDRVELDGIDPDILGNAELLDK
ncbi:peptidylprolyl isomerase [Aliiroseovarius marinus]|uniref:peptidylprolyl isomerase n=1 Tax=Aliiroseovarius marinus TaxID=2500159 RepID=UPI003D7D3B70